MKTLPLPSVRSLLAAWLLVAVPAHAGESPRDVAGLMEALARVPAAQSVYAERKQVALLEAPLHYEGRLTYRAPDYLKKEVLKPRQESYEISGSRLVIEREGERRELALNEHPPLQAFIESLRATLAGDLATLQRNYAVDYRPVAQGWRLQLTPRASQLRIYIQGIEVRGEGARVDAVEIREASGDVSHMTIKPIP